MPKIGQTTKTVTANGDVLTPYWQTTDGRACRLYLGNVTDVLARLPARSVQCCVTSPPYWGLRDYGTGTWEGGDPACEHDWGRKNDGHVGKAVHDPTKHKYPFRGTASGSAYLDQGKMSSMVCLNGCGARRTDQQLGSEPSPDCGTHGQAQCGRCFVCSMVAVFRGVRRVLRDDGTLWLNLGDTYSASGGHTKQGETSQRVGRANVAAQHAVKGRVPEGIPSGNLVGVPWRVALALQADGWVLRQDVIWAKPSPMPESVTNRCTKAHEYVFLLTKRADYFCDMDAVKESHTSSGKRSATLNEKLAARTAAGSAYAQSTTDKNGFGRDIEYSGRNKRSVWSVEDDAALARWLAENGHDDILWEFIERGRNKGDVWRVSAQGYAGAHFATFPPRLIEPCILAGTSAKGCCPRCGTPWGRVVYREKLRRERPNEYTKRTPSKLTGGRYAPPGQPPHSNARTDKEIGNTCGNGAAGVGVTTAGWEPGCDCPVDLFGQAAAPVPCLVLDPFVGSGTTAAVCADLGRHSVGIDLNEKYLRVNAVPRISGAYLARPATARLVPAAVRDADVFGGGEEC